MKSGDMIHFVFFRYFVRSVCRTIDESAVVVCVRIVCRCSILYVLQTRWMEHTIIQYCKPTERLVACATSDWGLAPENCILLLYVVDFLLARWLPYFFLSNAATQGLACRLSRDSLVHRSPLCRRDSGRAVHGGWSMCKASANTWSRWHNSSPTSQLGIIHYISTTEWSLWHPLTTLIKETIGPLVGDKYEPLPR